MVRNNKHLESFLGGRDNEEESEKHHSKRSLTSKLFFLDLLCGGGVGEG